jgi:hypothetical protein
MEQILREVHNQCSGPMAALAACVEENEKTYRKSCVDQSREVNRCASEYAHPTGSSYPA